MKKRPCLMPVFLILLTCSHAMADGRLQDTSIEACNALYHENSFEDAIGCYQRLSNSEHSANVLYNIANSYAQLDQPGYSVLYYLRALSLNPGDSDISGNLAMVKDEKGLFPPEKPAVQRFFGLLTLAQWSILCLLSAAGYLVYACTRLRRPKNMVLETFVLFLGTILLAAGVFGAGARYREWQQAVVVKDSRLLVSPFENGASLGSIDQGSLVSPHKEHGDYWYVTDERGRKGWLKAETFESILPQ